METTLSAVCTPFPSLHGYAKYCSKEPTQVLGQGYTPVLPLSYYGIYYRTLLESPPDYKSKATQKASHLTSTQITENNSDDMSLYLKMN